MNLFSTPIVSYSPLVTESVLASPVGAAMTGKAGGGTVQDFINEDAEREQTVIYVTDAPYNAACDKVTNDLAALNAAVAACPVGGKVVIPGPLRIADTFTLTKRIDIETPTDAACILVDVGTTKDGVVLGPGTGPNNALHRSTIHLNVYGSGNSCRNAVVVRRLDRSLLYLNVSAGTIQTKDGAVDDEGFGVVFDGCLQNSAITVQSSVNFRPPYAELAAAFQRDHILIKRDAANAVATNINEFNVNLEGGRHGIALRAMIGEAKNIFRGTIQGLTGQPFLGGGQTGVNFGALWLEANKQQTVLDDMKLPVFGPGMLMLTSNDPDLTPEQEKTASTLRLTNSLLPVIEPLIYGRVDYDQNTVAPLFKGGLSSFPNDIAERDSYFDTAIQSGPTFAIDTSNLSYGGDGMPSLANLHQNPWVDLWPEGDEVFSVPGIAGGASNAVLLRESNGVFPEGVGVECRVTIGTAGVDKGALVTLPAPHATWNRKRWVSFMVMVRLRSSNTAGVNLRVRVGEADNVAGMATLGDVTARNSVVRVRGGFPVSPTKAPAILLTLHNGTSYTTGVFDIGGISVVNGPIAPKYIDDSQARRNNPVGSIANRPAFVGQMAVVSGEAWIATGTSASTDWKKVTP